MPTKKHTVQKWKLTRLKDHPRQADLFGDLGEGEFAALVADMKEHGQRVPVEVLPNGTIIAGHQRVRAARQLGWTHIEVIVRADLTDADAAETAFISDNLVRRHLSPLARARAILRLTELRHPIDDLCGFGQEEMKAYIGAQLGISARSVNRYLLVLRTPAAVQAAFDQGAVPLTKAGRVALLPKKEQEAMTARIIAGEEAGKVVGEYLAPHSPKADSPDTAFCRLVRALKRELPLIEDHLAEIVPDRLGHNRSTLSTAREVLSSLLDRSET